MRTLPFATILLASAALGACATTYKPPVISYDDTPRKAVLAPDPPKPVRIVELPKLLPLPAVEADAGREESAAGAPVAAGVDINALNFRYRVEGDSPAWRPLRAFDDGQQVFIEFPAGIAQGEMPPLWVIGAEGDGQLVNYRVRGNHMIVDRLFAAAELKLGGKHQETVRVVRTDGRPQS